MCKKFTQTFSVQANKCNIEKVFHIIKSVFESWDFKAFLRHGVLEDKCASVVLRDVCGIQDWLQAGPAGTFLLTLWDCESRVRRRPPGLHGTLWDTGPAAGTWASPPDLRPSNKPSQQICSDKTRKFAYWRYTGLAKKFGFFHKVLLLTFWSIWYQLHFQSKCRCGEEDILKINLFAEQKWVIWTLHVDFNSETCQNIPPSRDFM